MVFMDVQDVNIFKKRSEDVVESGRSKNFYNKDVETLLTY